MKKVLATVTALIAASTAKASASTPDWIVKAFASTVAGAADAESSAA